MLLGGVVVSPVVVEIASAVKLPRNDRYTEAL